jgi:hypothetical protein
MRQSAGKTGEKRVGFSFFHSFLGRVFLRDLASLIEAAKKSGSCE